MTQKIDKTDQPPRTEEKRQQEGARAKEHARQRESVPVGYDSLKDPGTVRHLRKEAAEAKTLKRYIPWTPRLEEWFDKPARELPQELLSRVELYMDWDSTPPDERRRVASDWDSQHDPANEPLQRYWFGLHNEINDLKGKLEELNNASWSTVSELEYQKKEGAALSKRISEVENELSLSQKRGFRAGPRDSELQYDANELAKRWQEKNKCFSKRDIAKELLRLDRWAACFKTYERIERILRKEW